MSACLRVIVSFRTVIKIFGCAGVYATFFVERSRVSQFQGQLYKPCSNSRLDLVLSVAFRPCSARNLLLPWFEELFYMDQNPGSR